MCPKTSRKVDCLVFLELYLKTFPMRYHGLNLDAEKASERDLTVALHVGPVVLRVGQFLLKMASFPVFDYDHGFSLMVDDLLL